jgi:hypothetical protein
MEVRIRRTVERYLRTGILYVVREPVESGVVRPYNNIMRTNRDAGIGGVERVIKAVLRSTAEHVNESWPRLLGLSFLLTMSFKLYQTYWIGGYRYVSRYVLVSKKT